MDSLTMFYRVIDVVLLGCAAWAFVSCLRARPDAFPAIGRSSKGLWLALTGAATLYSLGAVPLAAPPMGLIAIGAVVVTAVYLLDIRPRIAEITRGR